MTCRKSFHIRKTEGLPLIWTIVGSIVTVAIWSQIRTRRDVGEDEV
jgi:hypothetical protein